MWLHIHEVGSIFLQPESQKVKYHRYYIIKFKQLTILTFVKNHLLSCYKQEDIFLV
jgi:hypothetical protein